jgi:hypothetical protein
MANIVVKNSTISDNGGAGIKLEGSKFELDVSDTKIERNAGGGIVMTAPDTIGSEYLQRLKNEKWYPNNISDAEMVLILRRIAQSKDRTEAQDAVGSSKLWAYVKDKGIDLAQFTLSIIQILR